MVHMSRAYLTGKQMSRDYWYYSIAYAARMMNMLPGTLHGSIVSPFMLVHGVAPDVRTWVPLFSVCYFHQERDSNIIHERNLGKDAASIKIQINSVKECGTRRNMYTEALCSKHFP